MMHLMTWQAMAGEYFYSGPTWTEASELLVPRGGPDV